MYVVLMYSPNQYLTADQYPETYSARQDYAKTFNCFNAATEEAIDLTYQTGSYHYVQRV